MTDSKRAPDGGDNGDRDRDRDSNSGKKPKFGKSSSNIEPGMAGFLFSCQKGKEALAVREAYTLLNEVAPYLIFTTFP